MPSESPAAVLVDSSSNEVSVTGNRLDTNATIDAALPAGTNNIGDVDVASSVLPTGAATEATLATLATEAKLEAVRVLLASLDGKDFATQTTLAALAAEDFATQTTLAALLSAFNAEDFASETKLEAVRVLLNTIATSVNQGTAAALSAPWPIRIVDGSSNPATITEDAGIYRQEVIGKVTVVGAAPPPATTPQTINADTPLTVGTHDTSFTIPTGETFHLQGLIAGNEDPTKGASIEIIYDDGAEHLIARVYVAGQSEPFGFNDITIARDGTTLAGTGTEAIVVRRAKYTGTDIAIDAVVTGYTDTT